MFKKYMHIERIGNDATEGILDGTCYIFPKIDGSNASVWLQDGTLHAGSRKRELTLEDDNADFCKWTNGQESIKAYLSIHQNHTLFGEWLVPHSLKTYRKDAWKQFYIFDVWDRESEKYISYDTYAEELEKSGIEYIPLLEVVTDASEEHLVKILMRNTYLIDEGKGYGEGIVIKRYDFVNRFGRTVWGKVVSNQFKEKHVKEFKAPQTNMVSIENKIAAAFVTEGRASKIIEKMRETGPIEPKRIPEYLGRIWHEIIEEEMWEILKKYKTPTIDFKKFSRAVTSRAKTVAKDLFEM